MSAEKLNILIDDTLYARRMERIGCFVENVGARDLCSEDSRAMPIIEKIVLESVLPRKAGIDPTKVDPQFPGFDNLLIAYCKIAKSAHLEERAVQFFERFPPSLHLVIVRVARLVWASNGSLPKKLLGLIRDIANNGGPVEARFANYHLRNTWHVSK